MRILNLGCGTKVSEHPNVVNIDWSIYLRVKKNPVLRRVAPLLINGERLNGFKTIPANILVHNLAKGIPFPADSVDVVYHSHLLEHLDRDIAKHFLLEIKRVLRPGGILRIVVPDFERFAKDYVHHLSVCENDKGEAGKHDEYISAMISQCVRREAHGTSHQKPFRRFIENTLLGDARRRGETHQWMYDRINLSWLLIGLGYKNPVVQQYNVSLISDWNKYMLDTDLHGNEYKTDSFYMEAQK
ncbi:MAG: uncharacterized protein JWQ40_4017 [Segetibacter sp.]|nr:uncharacterized protein [Segetibacter sp.]